MNEEEMRKQSTLKNIHLGATALSALSAGFVIVYSALAGDGMALSTGMIAALGIGSTVFNGVQWRSHANNISDLYDGVETEAKEKVKK